ncbi:MAG: M15 family metallopeptidase [Lysinibacillus sp.]
MGKKGKVRKILITSIMIGSLLQVGVVASAEGKLVEPTANDTMRLALDSSSYKDFDAKAHWAPAMRWAIDENVISGYQNQKHPSDPKKGVGNWLNPSGRLTESQMLTIILRYQEPDLLKEEKANATKADLDKNYAFAEYKLANDLGMVTTGSTTNVTPASQQVTRGQMARALVSYIYGHPVTLQQAVKFMYVNKITTGKNAAHGQTLYNFGVTDKLTRAQMVVFFERYVKQDELEDTLSSPSDPDYGYTWEGKMKLVWGDKESGFETKEAAEASMTKITVPVWKVGSKGEKVKANATLTVHKNLAEPYKKVFQEIFNGPEKFPIKDMGAYSWRTNNTRSEHRQGTAIDINANENMHCQIDANGNVTKILVGSIWKPHENKYSIREDGDVVRAFKKHGFVWGGDAWPKSRDYMHFSYFGE